MRVNLGDAVATPRTSRIVRTYGHTRVQVNGEKKRDAGIGTDSKSLGLLPWARYWL